MLPGNWIRPPSPAHDVTELEMCDARHLIIGHDYPGFESRYHREGEAAYRAGASIGANPYDLCYDGGVPCRQWDDGWERAARDQGATWSGTDR
jgi:hypothetical protein